MREQQKRRFLGIQCREITVGCNIFGAGNIIMEEKEIIDNYLE